MKRFALLCIALVCLTGFLQAQTDEIDEMVAKWKKEQDSLRTAILKSKQNNVLKNSLLQELYIRNVVREKNDTLYFFIPFDLHFIDCGAPDCYSTDLSFKFRLGDRLVFPKKLHFTEHEHGCVDKETRTSGEFELKEIGNSHVTYHSPTHKSTLIIFKDYGRRIYYFAGVGPDEATADKVGKIFAEYNEEDPNLIVPYQSTVMSIEYGDFMK